MGRYAKTLIRQALAEGPTVLIHVKKYWKKAVFDLLVEQIDRWLSEAPAKALPWALVGPAFARRVAVVDPRVCESTLLCRAHARLGSAYRALGRFADAEGEYRTSEGLGVSALEIADVLRRKAYLRLEQGLGDEARLLVEQAIEIYRLEGDLFDRNPLGWALVARGQVEFERGDRGKALADFTAALGLIDHRSDPMGYYGTIHNLSVVLVDSGTPRDLGIALNHLNAAYRRFVGYSQRHLAKYKLRWLQGLAQKRFGAVRQAEIYFRMAREGLVALEAPLEVAMISLDLGLILLEDRRFEELRRLAFETHRLAQGLGATTEALATLALWVRATQGDLDHHLLGSLRTNLARSTAPAGL